MNSVPITSASKRMNTKVHTENKAGKKSRKMIGKCLKRNTLYDSFIRIFLSFSSCPLK